MAEYERKIAELERKVGQLTMEVDLLKNYRMPRRRHHLLDEKLTGQLALSPV